MTKFTSRHNMNRHLRDIHGKDKFLNDIILATNSGLTGQQVDDDEKVYRYFESTKNCD